MGKGDTAELWEVLSACREAFDKWEEYFNPDQGEPGDEDKQLAFYRWTEAQKKAIRMIRNLYLPPFSEDHCC